MNCARLMAVPLKKKTRVDLFMNRAQPKGFNMFNRYSLKVSAQFMTPTSQVTPCGSNGLVYKPNPRFLAQNLSKKGVAYTRVFTVGFYREDTL